MAKSGTANFYNGQVTNSLRVNQGDSMTRAFGTSPTSSTTMSFGGWCKFTGQHYMNLFSATLGGSGVPQSFITINGDLKILLQSWTGSANIFHYISTRVIRDTSAWMHLWVQIDTTDGTASDRVKLYVNGVRETVFDTEVNPSSGVTVVGFNQNYTHYFGHTNASYGIGAYLADWWFLDGQDVSPVDTVGEFKNGVFIPKEYSSPTFGNKGFHLEFKQSGVGTASTSTIGADTSGNNNHWTSSGIAAHDCNMPDSPENNMCTLNPLEFQENNSGAFLAEGNLKWSNVNANVGSTFGFGNSGGKYYWEYLYLSSTDSNQYQGVTLQKDGISLANAFSTGIALYFEDGTTRVDGTSGTGFGGKIGADNIIQFKLDLDNGTLQFGKNNTYIDALTLPTSVGGWRAGGIQSGGTGGTRVFVANYGQDSSFAGTKTAQGNTDENGIGDFYYAVPSGFLAVCSSNLPEPTISPNALTQADDYFNTVIYDGTNGEKVISDVGFQSDFVWLKRRNADGHNHMWHDSSRPLYGYIRSSLTSAENTNSGYDWFKSFDTNGFTVSYSSTGGGNTSEYSTSGGTYVAWNWKANGGTTVTNEAGSIDSTVQANTTAGFSIVTYSGNADASATIGHGLGVVPKMIMVKQRDEVGNWIVFTETTGATNKLNLNATTASATSALFNDTAPTSTVFSVKDTSTEDTFGDGHTYVAYCFADVVGYSKIGSFIGNNSADGPFIYLGFRPAFFILKDTTTAGSWSIYDSVRDTSNSAYKELEADAGAERTNAGAGRIDFLSNGFKIRDNDGGSYMGQEAAAVFIYMAFAEVPFKYANAK